MLVNYFSATGAATSCTRPVSRCTVKNDLKLMHRLTARLLLVLLLVGVFAPVAMAVSAEQAHACCLRKPMHGRASHDAEFHASPGCCQHDCCGSQTVSQWAHLSRSATDRRMPASTSLRSVQPPIVLALEVSRAHSGRAPPQISIA
jgi:hypothetical protein